MTEMFGEAWSPMSVPDLAPDDDDDTVGFGFQIDVLSKMCPIVPLFILRLRANSLLMRSSHVPIPEFSRMRISLQTSSLSIKNLFCS